MPAMHYTVRWPDAQISVCYSPSLVIHDLLAVGHDYPVPEFIGLVREATAIANERVQAKSASSAHAPTTSSTSWRPSTSVTPATCPHACG